LGLSSAAQKSAVVPAIHYKSDTNRPTHRHRAFHFYPAAHQQFFIQSTAENQFNPLLRNNY